MKTTSTVLAIMALAPSILATPVASPEAAPAPVPVEINGKPFSFVNWVDSILENPKGDHLSPEEAVAAFYASSGQPVPSAADKPETPGITRRELSPLLYKRARCYEQPNTEAWLPDAVACINAVASKGGQQCPDYLLCQIGRAAITADGSRTSNCNDCARGAGYVLDACTRPNSAWVQGSEYAHGNGNELIRVRHP
ncbi:hypothetical protein V8F20_009602 [Naviculisporaceae sp. PSN 640]